MTKKEKTREILRRLKKKYKKTGPFLDWTNPLELIVATSLSAQCTDVRVNMVTKKLFKKYKTAQDYAHAPIRTLEKEVYSTGFYHNKAKNLKGLGKMLVSDFEGEVPADFEALQKLPGVAKKTAAIIMSKAFGIEVSVAVDTHVYRIARLLVLTKATSIEGVRRDLNKIIDQKDYLRFNEFLITHGRAICVARRPRCQECVLLNMCPSGQVIVKKLRNKRGITH